MKELLLLEKKDAGRHFRLFFPLALAVLAAVSALAFGVWTAFLQKPLEQRKIKNVYNLVPVSTDRSGNKELADRFQGWIDGRGMAWAWSEELWERTGRNSLVVTGDPGLFWPEWELEETESVQVFEAGGGKTGAEIRVGNRVFPVRQIEMTKDDLPCFHRIRVPDGCRWNGESESFLVFYIGKERLSDWISWENGEVMQELIGGAVLHENAAGCEKELEKLLEGSFLALGNYSDVPGNFDRREETFFRSLVPCLLLASFCLAGFFGPAGKRSPGDVIQNLSGTGRDFGRSASGTGR